MTLKTENLAVVITDIVGYTEATEHKSRRENEELLKNYTALLLPIARRFKGRLIKTIGDALLMVFKSPTDAMICSMAMQDALFGYNRRLPPEKQIHIRIAASLGELRVANKDIFGDPVNVTSRIESITPADEIYFSEAIYLAMNKAEVPAKEVGMKKLKGISSELRIYQIPRFATSVLVPENVMGSADMTELSYPYGGTHLLAPSQTSSTIDRIMLPIGNTLSAIFAYKYAKLGALAAAAVLIAAMVMPRIWPNKEKPYQATSVSQPQPPAEARVPQSPSVAVSASPSQPQQEAASRPVAPEPGQPPNSTAPGAQEAAPLPHATQAVIPAEQTVPPPASPQLQPLPSKVAQQPPEQQDSRAAGPTGQDVSAPESTTQNASAGLHSESKTPVPAASTPKAPTSSRAPTPGASTGSPAPAPTPIDAALPAGSESSQPPQKAQSAAVTPQKPKPKSDKHEAKQSLGGAALEAPRAAPPPPWRHKITSFSEAKSAYAAHIITAEEYRTIVGQLKLNYSNEVDQLKLDFRAGRIDKAEYYRRAVEIKTRYR